MKFLIAVVVLAALASAEYQVKTREDLTKFRDECVAKLGTPQAELEKYKKWNFPDDETAHSYLHCILKKFELYDDEKGFNVEDIHKQMVGGSHADHSDDTHAKIENCAKEANAAEANVRAYRGALCFMREHLHLVQKSVHAHEHDHSQH
ncbi:general odorant-binding protein 99a-like [Eupeodes corollae]|uniref:OBP10 n=1 Tax=Eupeodes corollae TaxID=290404 RepID=A0A8F9WLT6_9MUSC|nr:general odorant-binding protein 99a-like [Eupeodes corollae]QYL00037.1 OBP10 [Eupeodes corollae]